MTVSKNGAVFGALCAAVVIVVYIYKNIPSEPSDLSRIKTERMVPKSIDKKMHIAYLRVPKTGSTTLYCMLFRYGLKNRLKMYIPKSLAGVSYEKQMLMLKNGTIYDIFMTHTYYNSTFFTHIFPKDSALIGSVREPTQRIISHAFYHRPRRRIMHNLINLSDKQFIHKVLGNLKKYDVEHIMAKYFGMERMKRNNNVHLRQYLESLNARFWLVLVLEKLDESLVLLKRILNWSFADILYDSKNAGEHIKVDLSIKEKQNIYSTNRLDFEIYDFFKTELDNKIQRQGNDFQAEVVHFKKILQIVKAFCGNNAVNGSMMEFPSSKSDHSFKVLSSECELIFKIDQRKIKTIEVSREAVRIEVMCTVRTDK